MLSDCPSRLAIPTPGARTARALASKGTNQENSSDERENSKTHQWRSARRGSRYEPVVARARVADRVEASLLSASEISTPIVAALHAPEWDAVGNSPALVQVALRNASSPDSGPPPARRASHTRSVLRKVREMQC